MVRIEAGEEGFRLISETGDEGEIAAYGSAAILVSPDGIYYSMMAEDDDNPSVFKVLTQEKVDSELDEVSFDLDGDEDEEDEDGEDDGGEEDDEPEEE